MTGQTAEANSRAYKWLQILIQMAAAYMILYLDVFGLSSATDNASREAFRKIYAAAYPTEARDNIAVVTLRDDDLPLFRDSPSNYWPMAYRDMARLVEAIADTNPKAIFLDFYIPVLNPLDKGQAQMEETLNRITQEQQIPVLLADHYRRSGTSTRTAPDFPPVAPCLLTADASPLQDQEHCAKLGGGIPVMAAWHSEQYEYPLYVETEAGGWRESPTAKAGESIAPSAAVKLFSLLKPEAKLPSGPPITVIWGKDTAAKYNAQEQNALGCLRDTSQLEYQAAILTEAFLGPLTFSEMWHQPNRCYFHDDYSARQFLNEYNSGRVYDALEGRVVIVGANMGGNSDIHVSPVQGPVPGAHLHAMALDNLLVYGSDYLRDPNYWFGANLSTVFEILLIGLTLLFVHQEKERPLYRRSPWPIKAIYMTIVFIGLMLVLLLLIWLMLSVGRFVPVNWTALCSIALLAVFPNLDWVPHVLIRAGARLRLISR